MRHSILRFFLIFACVALPLHSHACWDDSYDDYYDYDDYDDDWWDDWGWDDDWVWNYDDDEDIVYGEIDDSKYDMEDDLGEVVVTYEGDDDWWRTDYGDDDDYGNDDDWYDDYEDYDDDNSSYIHPETSKEPDKVYVKCKDGTLCLD